MRNLKGSSSNPRSGCNQPRKSQMTAQNQSSKILIADDSDILNNMLRDVFEDNGFEVVQAFDGAECKSAFLQHRPDLAFIDVQMPKADGIEVLRFIKQRAPRTIVVVMTGVGNEEVAVKAMKLGAADYLTKPFGTPEVVGLAHKLLENRRSGEETVKLKRKIQQSEKYLAHLTTIINEALITTDHLGKIQFINRAASKMWGYTVDELINHDLHFLIRGEAGALLHRDLVRDTISQGKVEGEFLFRKKDKGTFPGYLSTSVILESNKARGIVVVVADLTRLYEIERRLKQSEKLASLGKVVEGIAHEVRNCLTSLGGFTLRLQKTTADNPVSGQYTKIILDDVSRLEKMVRDIEEYVRFSKFYKFTFCRTKLAPLVESAWDRVLAVVLPSHAKSVSFTIKADKNLTEINADPEALEEAFYQLILNAYEAMPNGGRLTVNMKTWDP